MNLPWLALITLGIGVLLIFITAIADRAIDLVGLSDIRKIALRKRQAHLIETILSNRRQWSATAVLMTSMGMILVGVGVVQFDWGGLTIFWLIFLSLTAWLIAAAAHITGRAVAGRQPLTHLTRLSLYLRFVTWTLHPFVASLRRISQWVGGEADNEEEDILFAGDRVKLVISGHGDESEIEESEKEMITSILEMNETVAREVMVPRVDMVAIEVEAGLVEALQMIIDAGHSRIPVFEGNIDQIIGVLYAKDLLKIFSQNLADIPIRTLLRPAHFVPLSKDVKSLFAEMRKHRVHIAIIVDEYGGTAGLVTIEDILEEIVGDIQDEYDSGEAALVQPLGADVYLISARIDTYTLSKLLEVDLEDDDADTLSGLIFSLLGHVPQQGEHVEIMGWRFTVVSVEGRRINHARAERVRAPHEEQPDADVQIDESTSVAHTLS